MSQPPDSSSECSEIVVAVLDWLDDLSAPTETVDEAFELLAHRRRRVFLHVMRSYGEAVTLPDAAEAVASQEFGRDVVELSAERVANVYLSLYHDHLPRLVDAGLVRYDQDRDLVAPTSAPA